MEYSTIKKLTIPEGEVKQVSIGNSVIWKGTWTFTINIGDYIRGVRYKIGSDSAIVITSTTTIEIDSGKTLTVSLQSYDSNDNYWDYTMYPEQFRHTNFITFSEEDDGGSITVYQTRERHYYTNTISAGNYISTLKAKVGNGSWTSASSSVSVTHLYEDTVSWELVSYNTDTQDNTTIYTYTGDTSGSFTNFTDNKTINRSLSTEERHYTATVTAGNYVSTVRIRVSGGSFGSAGASASVTTTYGQQIIWEAVDYNGNTAQYTYSGDTSGRETTYGNWSLTVNRTRSTNSYTITFKNHDGTTLQTKTVSYGSTPSYTGSTPTKSSDNNYTYTFSGWSPSITSVTGTATYTAQFTPNTRYYYTTITAGSNVTTVKARAGNGSWSSASSSVQVKHTYNQTIYWQMVNYKTTTTSGFMVTEYSGATSGSLSGGTGTSLTVSRTQGTPYHREPREEDFNFDSYDFDGSYYEFYYTVWFDQAFDFTITMSYGGRTEYSTSNNYPSGVSHSSYDDAFYTSHEYTDFHVSWSWNGKSGNFYVGY